MRLHRSSIIPDIQFDWPRILRGQGRQPGAAGRGLGGKRQRRAQAQRSSRRRAERARPPASHRPAGCTRRCPRKLLPETRSSPAHARLGVRRHWRGSGRVTPRRLVANPGAPVPDEQRQRAAAERRPSGSIPTAGSPTKRSPAGLRIVRVGAGIAAARWPARGAAGGAETSGRRRSRPRRAPAKRPRRARPRTAVRGADRRC